MATTAKPQHYDVIILGAGYAALMAAVRLSRGKGQIGRGALVNAVDHFVGHVRLQETVAQPIGIEALLAGGDVAFIHGRVATPDHVIAAIMIDTDGMRICAVFSVSNPDTLHSLMPFVRAETIAS
jgi:hypothetical protein